MSRIFGEWEFPPADKVFALTSGIVIGPQPKDKKKILRANPESLLARRNVFVKKYFLPHTGNREDIGA